MLQNVLYKINGSTPENISRELGDLQMLSCRPSIFIVNTFKARDLVARLDPILGDTPTVFLRRGMLAGESGLDGHLATATGSECTMQIIKGMSPRLTSIWYYGRRTQEDVVLKAARAIEVFLADGEFSHIEIANAFESRTSSTDRS